MAAQNLLLLVKPLEDQLAAVVQGDKDNLLDQ
jgi:hypothetical protein